VRLIPQDPRSHPVRSLATGYASVTYSALWSRTCSHCPNLHPAPEFTAEQWSVIVTHMRTHGDLTQSEAVAIAEYLRSVRERSTSSP
jgi:hypothetical protein